MVEGRGGVGWGGVGRGGEGKGRRTLDIGRWSFSFNHILTPSVNAHSIWRREVVYSEEMVGQG